MGGKLISPHPATDASNMMKPGKIDFGANRSIRPLPDPQHSRKLILFDHHANQYVTGRLRCHRQLSFLDVQDDGNRQSQDCLVGAGWTVESDFIVLRGALHRSNPVEFEPHLSILHCHASGIQVAASREEFQMSGFSESPLVTLISGNQEIHLSAFPIRSEGADFSVCCLSQEETGNCQKRPEFD